MKYRIEIVGHSPLTLTEDQYAALCRTIEKHERFGYRDGETRGEGCTITEVAELFVRGENQR